MITAEFSKLRTMRNPLFYAAAFIVGVLIPSAVLIWYTPSSESAYTDAFTTTFGVLALLLGIEFGGWLLGAEYRQGTVKRLLASEPRRLRALSSKGLVGATALMAVMGLAGVGGWSAARAVGSMHDVDVPWQGRILLAQAMYGLVAAGVAYALSAITRSDSFAKVGTIAVIVVIEPLISVVPKIGDYTIGTALERLDVWVSGQPPEQPIALSTGAATATIAVWLGVLFAAASAVFAYRDV